MPVIRSHKTRCLVPLLVLSLALIACRSKGLSDEQLTLYAQAKTLYYSGDYSKVIELLEAPEFSARSGHQGLLLVAKSHFLLFEPAKAEPILQKLTRRYKGYTEAEIWLIRTYLAQEKFDKAEREIECAMEFNPEDPRLLQLAASLQETNNEYQRAFEYYSRVVNFADEIGKSEIALAQLYYRFDQKDKARYHLERATGMISPDSILRRPLAKLMEKIEKDTE